MHAEDSHFIQIYINYPSKNFHLYVSRQNSHFKSRGDMSRKRTESQKLRVCLKGSFLSHAETMWHKWGESCICDTSHSKTAPVFTQCQQAKTCSLLLPSAWAPDHISSQFGLWIGYSMHPGILVQPPLVGSPWILCQRWCCLAMASWAIGPCSALHLHTQTKLWAAPCPSCPLATFTKWPSQETRAPSPVQQRLHCFTPSTAPF